MRICLTNHQSPGDVLMLTAAVRDMKQKYPQMKLRVESSADAFFEHNPYIENNHRVPVVYDASSDKPESPNTNIKRLAVRYDDDNGQVDNPYSIHKVHEHRKHFVYGMIGYLNCKLGLSIELTKPYADLYLTEAEKRPMPDLPKNYWVANAGVGPFFPAKQWHPANWQKLFELLPEVTFVQMGAADPNHKHPVFNLPNVINYVGKTTLRSSLSLLDNAQGLICGVTYAMHAYAALQPQRPCIVIAGGREQWWWEAYPGHNFLHTMGSFACCTETRACWKAECENKVEGSGSKCMELIRPEMVAEIVRSKHAKR